MKFAHLILASGLSLSATACVESEAPLASVEQGVCTFSNKATAPMPVASNWTGTLPGNIPTNANEQIWFVLGDNGSIQQLPTTYTVFQVDGAGKKVVWRSSFPAASRTTVVNQAASRAGYLVFGRQPPPPPWPPIDPGIFADRIVDKALTMRATFTE